MRASQGKRPINTPWRPASPGPDLAGAALKGRENALQKPRFTKLHAPKHNKNNNKHLKTYTCDKQPPKKHPHTSQERAPTSVAYAETQSMFLDSLAGDAAWLARYAVDRDGTPVPFGVVERLLRAEHPYAVFQVGCAVGDV